MPIKPADQQRLDTMYAEHRASYAGRREDYFALLYLTRKFGMSVEDVAHQVAFGGNDYGLDAYYLDRAARNLYLYQFKWSEDHGQFKQSMERLARDGLPRIFGNPHQDRSQNDVLLYLKADLAEQRHAVEKVYLHFVFKGDLDAAEKSEGLDSRREDLQNKAHLVTQYFGDREVAFQVELISDRPGRKPPVGTQTFKVPFTDAGTTTHGGRAMHVGFVPLVALYEIHQGLGQHFFDRNIRAGLSADNAPNRKIFSAVDRIVLKEDEEPSIFAFRHNGVTIAAERVRIDDGHATLHVPRLLNGAQTVSSLARFMEHHADNAVLKRNRARLDGIRVLAKLVEADPSSDFVTELTISNNQQNPVHPWTLRAMDRRQVDLADKFREEVGIYYSRQEGAFENLSDEEREELGIGSARDIRIRPLAMTLLAVQGDIANMRNLAEVFESQKLYDATFRASYLNANADAIVLGYKAGQMLKSVTDQLRETLPGKIVGANTQGRNLAWALVLQALLNDPKYDAYREEFGADLVKQDRFRTVLRALTRAKVARLVKTLCSLPISAPKVDEGRFDFLRTNDAYKRAMDAAADEFGWSKRSF